MLGRWYRYENELHLMEVECIEPDLYLNLSEVLYNVSQNHSRIDTSIVTP
jgi:hypothetical protein